METNVKTTIIYNKFSFEAVIATAILKGTIEDAVVVDVSQLVDDKSDKFIWIGVEPKKHIAEFFHRTKDKEHFVFAHKTLKSGAVNLNPFKRKVEMIEEEEIEIEPVQVKETLIDMVGNKFDLMTEEYKKLSFHCARFYDKNAELQYLAYVYANLVNAELCIASGDKFAVRPVTSTDIAIYNQDVRKVKTGFHNKYQQLKVIDGEKVKIAVHTSISDFSFHLALRVSKLVHRNFLNMTMGLSGVIAYTNMENIVFEKAYGDPLVLH